METELSPEALAKLQRKCKMYTVALVSHQGVTSCEPAKLHVSQINVLPWNPAKADTRTTQALDVRRGCTNT